MVSFGVNGGFTGGGTGYRIAPDGMVSRWTVLLAGEDPVYEEVGPADVSALEEALKGLEGVRLHERSTMTGFLEWSGGRLQWAVGATLLAPVERAVEAAKAVVRAVGGAPPPGL